eukprot:2703878-Amphidinium_carterae.3
MSHQSKMCSKACHELFEDRRKVQNCISGALNLYCNKTSCSCSLIFLYEYAWMVSCSKVQRQRSDIGVGSCGLCCELRLEDVPVIMHAV